jgi:hypothetical protein
MKCGDHKKHKGTRSVLWIKKKLDPLQSALEALKRDTVLKKS